MKSSCLYAEQNNANKNMLEYVYTKNIELIIVIKLIEKHNNFNDKELD